MKTWIKTFAAMVLLGATAMESYYPHSYYTRGEKIELFNKAKEKFDKKLSKYGKTFGPAYHDSRFQVSELDAEYPVILSYSPYPSNDTPRIYGLSKKYIGLNFYTPNIYDDNAEKLFHSEYEKLRENRDWGESDDNYNIGFMPLFWDNGSTIEPAVAQIIEPDTLRISYKRSHVDVSINKLLRVKWAAYCTDLFSVTDPQNPDFTYVFCSNTTGVENRTLIRNKINFELPGFGDVNSEFTATTRTHYMNAIIVRRIAKPSTVMEKYVRAYPAGTKFAGSQAETNVKSLIGRILRKQVKEIEIESIEKD